MKTKQLKEYTEAEIRKYEEMHQVLTEYNNHIGTDSNLSAPAYTDDEMNDYSTYRELVVAQQCRE